MFSFFSSFALAVLAQKHEEQAFLGWMRENNEYYVGKDYAFRLGLFLASARYVEESNRNPTKSYKLAVNQFSCMTDTEYQQYLGHIDSPPELNKYLDSEPSKRKDFVYKGAAPESLNWKKLGIDWAPVISQSSCGSCWACSLIAVLQCKWKMATQAEVLLSVSNFVDCCYLSFGCNGGDASLAYAYALISQGGQCMLEKDYPYTPSVGKCRFDKTKAVTHWQKCSIASRYTESKLKQKLYDMGPASVAIDASHVDFKKYSSGVYDDPACSTFKRSHEVLLIGYGHDATENKDFWIVKNTWGTRWGESGYVRMVRGSNMCAINSWVFWPLAQY